MSTQTLHDGTVEKVLPVYTTFSDHGHFKVTTVLTKKFMCLSDWVQTLCDYLHHLDCEHTIVNSLLQVFMC